MDPEELELNKRTKRYESLPVFKKAIDQVSSLKTLPDYMVHMCDFHNLIKLTVVAVELAAIDLNEDPLSTDYESKVNVAARILSDTIDFKFWVELVDSPALLLFVSMMVCELNGIWGRDWDVEKMRAMLGAPDETPSVSD